MIVVLMHRLFMALFYGNASNYLKDRLLEVSHMQQCFSRASYDFYVPRADVELCKESLLYNGPRMWYTLPDSLNALSELKMFKYRF